MNTDILPFALEKRKLFASRASLVLMALLGFSAMVAGLLPGLLATCGAFLMTEFLLRATRNGQPIFKRAFIPALIVIALPLVLVSVIVLAGKSYVFGAIAQYEALTQHLIDTVMRIREFLPEGLKRFLPEETSNVQAWVAGHLEDQAGHIAQVGKSWLHGSMLGYVGMIVGALIAVRTKKAKLKPLSAALLERGQRLTDAFKSIVVAQFWIAGFNAVMTSIFIQMILPAFDIKIPYAMTLVFLTFALGMIPIVGNLMVNAILAVVGGSVSPLVGLACLAFLILIHKTEYFINAKVVGAKTATPVWELLSAMFVCEAIFGVSGLVAAPLYYAYIKSELIDAEMI